ncbi:MAG: hypothetical protein OHK006_17300 [Thermodesulfovibrionales bacterium]
MKRRSERIRGKGSVELIEEATHVLRSMPGTSLAFYYTGTLPFVLGFLYFWADMSRGAFAAENAGRAALVVAALFVWMKCWQALFCRSVRSFLGEGVRSGGLGVPVLRAAAVQAAVQSTGLFLLPLGLITAAPFGWLYAFYQNMSYYGDGSEPDLMPVIRKAWRQAGLYPAQNHVLIFMLSSFAIVVFLNLLTLGYLLPSMLRTFFGIETVFSMAGWRFLNTTFLAIAAGLSYLIVNPLIKTVYSLRCFYGESLSTGEDLRMDLGRLRRKQVIAAGLLALCIAGGLAAAPAAAAGQSQTPAMRQSIPPEEMDRALESVIKKREYAWRMPRLKVAKEEKDNVFLRFMRSIAETAEGWCVPVKRWLRKAVQWVFDNVLEKLRIAPRGSELSGDWQARLNILLYVLIAAAASFLGIALFRMWKKRSRTGIGRAEAAPAAPDLSSEQVTASDLPPDGWLDLAQSLLKKGDRRLALRALYLASLSHLGGQGLIAVSRAKSNREYAAELERKARLLPDLRDAFSQNMQIFEGSWYGMHDVTEELFVLFEKNRRRIMAHAQQ